MDDYRGFAYPRPGEDTDLPDSARLAGERRPYVDHLPRREGADLHGKPRSAPILYANLKIALPAGGDVVVRNVVGAVRGGQLEGTLRWTPAAATSRSPPCRPAHPGHGLGRRDGRRGHGRDAIDTGSGDVVVRRLVGNGLVDTGSGDVTVENVSAGKLSVDTGSGDVTVRDGIGRPRAGRHGLGERRGWSGVELEELDADTGSGDVIVRSSLAQAKRLTAETGSGDVRSTAGRTPRSTSSRTRGAATSWCATPTPRSARPARRSSAPSAATARR